MRDKFDIALQYIWSAVFKPYIFGGDNPSVGFDCSGLVVEYFRACGILGQHEDLSAAELYNRFKHANTFYPVEGGLVFFGDPIKHVEIILDKDLSLGASGGDSTTTTTQEAIRHDAYIKVRPYKNRNPVSYINVRSI